MEPADYRERYLQRITPIVPAHPKAVARSSLLTLVDRYFPDHDDPEHYIDTLGRSDLLHLIEHCGLTPDQQRITSTEVLAGVRALRDGLDQKQTTIERLYAELARWQAETDRLRTELTTRDRELAAYREEIERLRSDVLELNSTLATIYKSISWRITRPIRWLRRRLHH